MTADGATVNPAASVARDRRGSDRGQPRPPRTVTADPTTPLILAALGVIAAAATFVVAGDATHIAGYLLAWPAPLTLVAVYKRRGLRLLFEEGVAPARWTARMAAAVIGTALATGTAHAWFIARRLA